MRDGIALCTGKGSAKYNFSAPHGAGRIMSRIQAKKQLSLADFQKEMKNAGVFTTTAVKETLDEAPGAYKDKELIIANIAETVEIYDFIKPVYNFKAGGEQRVVIVCLAGIFRLFIFKNGFVFQGFFDYNLMY